MKEAIRLIRRQMTLCAGIGERLDALKAVLRRNEGGGELSKAVKDIESMFVGFSKLEEEQGNFLRIRQQQNMLDFVQAQPASVERDVAMRLLSQAEDLQKSLSRELTVAKELLRHGKEFVDYHVNVLARTRADGPYGRPGNPEAQRSDKMFEANV